MAITWQKYTDPLAEFIPPDDEVRDGHLADKEAWEEDDRPEYFGPVVNTPMGLLGLNREKLAFCTYAMWVARTDFDVTRKHLSDMAEVRGVEVLRPLTRYAFLLAVGPQFDDAEVRAAVSALIDPPPFDRVAFLSRVAGIEPAWAVVGGPESELDLVAGPDEADVDRQVGAYGELWEVLARG